MADIDILALALAKKYTKDTADSLGSLRGAPATVKTIEAITGGNRITLEWEGTSGQKQTQSFDVMDGEGVIAGGETGQILAKKTDNDYDTEWIDAAGNVIDDEMSASSDHPVENRTIYAYVGALSSLTTAIKTSIVAAINELDGELGDLSTLTTTIKTSIVAAINEHDTEIGDLSTLTTVAKAALVSAINELDSEIGVLSNLTTTAKATLVAAINELDGEIGNLTSLTTTHKSTIVGAINEHDTEIGNIANLTTTAKSNLVGAVNELDSDIGDKSTLKTSAKTNVVAAVNELHDNVLEKDNTTVFTPTANYHPSTKKYVDDGDAAIETEIAAVANAGAKNLLKLTGPSPQDVSGITYTFNNDQTVTANGTATADSYCALVPNTKSDEYNFGNDYVLSGCPTGGSEQTYFLTYRIGRDSDDAMVRMDKDYGAGVRLGGFNSTTQRVRIMIGVKSGVTVNNLVFRPMIRPAAIKDDTYVPYAMSNLELTTKKQDAGKYLAADISNTNLWYTGDEAKLFAAVRSSNYMHMAFRNLPNAEQPATPITEWVQWNGNAMEWRKNDHNGDALLGRWTADEDSGWITPDGANIPAQYRKVNGTVFIAINGVSSGVIANNANYNIFNIPVGYRPVRTMVYSGVARLGSSPFTVIPVLFIAYNGGQIVVISGGDSIQPNTFSVAGTLVYPVG